MTNEISVYRGDTKTFTCVVTDSLGDAFDLTGYTAKFTVKTDSSLPDTSSTIGPITGTISTPATGIIEFSLSVTDTNKPAGVYYYDVQVNQSTTNVYTVVSSTFTIVQDTTKATS